ncbi:MAG: hypothetical protein HQK58_01720 [Deltaproteobacteria bacterium]|nr:hypothetical protein [Deltaproteobacteria bacterium]
MQRIHAVFSFINAVSGQVLRETGDGNKKDLERDQVQFREVDELRFFGCYWNRSMILKLKGYNLEK